LAKKAKRKTNFPPTGWYDRNVHQI
jgi:hypothetical protein